MSKIPIIQSERALITILNTEDSPLVHDYFLRNKAHLEPWDPIRTEEFYSEEAWRKRLELAQNDCRDGRALHFYALNSNRDEILGRCSYSNIVRGPFQACHLGYSLDEKQQGQGLMVEILEATLDYIFTVLNLHRVMANYIPRNLKSARVLEKLGFEKEGLAKSYLKIAGRWEDHVLTSKINSKHS